MEVFHVYAHMEFGVARRDSGIKIIDEKITWVIFFKAKPFKQVLNHLFFGFNGGGVFDRIGEDKLITSTDSLSFSPNMAFKSVLTNLSTCWTDSLIMHKEQEGGCHRYDGEQPQRNNLFAQWKRNGVFCCFLDRSDFVILWH